jgi:hypothetical protein
MAFLDVDVFDCMCCCAYCHIFVLSCLCAENMVRYLEFLAFINTTPPERVKFLDEGHIVPSKLCLKYALGPYDTRYDFLVPFVHRISELTLTLLTSCSVVVVDDANLDERLTLTVITRIDDPQQTCFACHTTDNNNALNFLTTVVTAISAGVFNRGDFLVLDNAR